MDANSATIILVVLAALLLVLAIWR